MTGTQSRTRAAVTDALSSEVSHTCRKQRRETLVEELKPLTDKLV